VEDVYQSRESVLRYLAVDESELLQVIGYASEGEDGLDLLDRLHEELIFHIDQGLDVQ
jgi:hypothetical protein